MLNFIASIPRNVWLLVMAQGLGMTTLNVNIIVVGLAGLSIAPEPWLATLPLSLQFVSSMLTTLPASLAMGRFGRRPIFIFGIIMTTLGMLGQGFAVVHGEFLLFVSSSLLVGISHGIGQFYRYAAADNVGDDQKSVVVSLVLAGGLMAAFLGSTIATQTLHLVPEVIYAGCFFAAAGIQVLTLSVVSQIKIPKPALLPIKGRPLSVFFKTPRFIAGMIAAAFGYSVMTFLMTAAPLQIVSVSKLSDAANAIVIQWHVVAMFAPAFFTGSLIKRFGVEKVMAVGLLIYSIAIAVSLTGTSFWHYFMVLLLIGGGWNTLYVGGSSIIASIATPQERAKVQGITDFVITLSMAVASLSAGALHYLLGWQAMTKLALVPMAIIALVIILMVIAERRPQAAAE
jgi:MFS family permease